MKFIVLVADGMADLPLDALRGRTPLEAAETTAMDEVVRRGKTGLVHTIPGGMESGPAVGNLALLGYDPPQHFTGRGPLEAASLGLELGQQEAVFRSNFITVSEGRLADYTAGRISTPESQVLVEALNRDLGDERVRFCPGVRHRHVVTLRDFPARALKGLVTTPPHEVVGQEVKDCLPRGRESRFLRELMRAAIPVLEGHEVNQVRVDLGENPANGIWLWGGGVMPRLKSFREIFGIKGSVVSRVGLVRGIARLAGLSLGEDTGISEESSSDDLGKLASSLSVLEKKDFAYLHLDAPDEASHRGDLKAKIRAIEAFDRSLVRPSLEYMTAHPMTRLLVATSHVADVGTRTNRAHPVPFAYCGSDVEPGGLDRFSEANGARARLRFRRGCELLPHFVRSEVL